MDFKEESLTQFYFVFQPSSSSPTSTNNVDRVDTVAAAADNELDEAMGTLMAYR